MNLVPYCTADKSDDLRAERHAFIKCLKTLQLVDDIPKPIVCVVVSLSAETFRINSEIPLAISVKACFGLVSMN